MADYKIRAHHGMCLFYFQGKGYSGEFVENMTKMKEIMGTNPRITLLGQTDDICRRCPSNIEGCCESAEKVARYDRGVLERTGLREGDELKWDEFEKLVIENILKVNKREEICGDCQWSSICI
ncbi:MAG: DUF1284 domain-containing protein [Clostridia bacterium]|nr:DUF1284 domain-containing protein [Clostridia bacterium]